MQLTKEDAPPDERIGNAPLPPSERDKLVEEIIALQRQIYLLERKLNEMDYQPSAFFERPKAR